MKKRFPGFFLAVLLLQGCGDSTSAPVPDRVVVTPQNISLDALGETQQYTARVEDTKGREMADVPVSWSVSDPTVASITTSGLVTALKIGTVAVRASAEGITGTANLSVAPLPADLTKVAGDGQVGIFRQLLPIEPTVEVRDGNGNPVEGLFVSFSVAAGGGTVSVSSARTGPDGQASTVWQLGCSNENPQRLEARISGLTVDFTATADLSALAICQETVPEGRVTHPYSSAIVAAGGDPATTTWDLSPTSGPLPAGLTLNADGSIDGTPAQSGSFPFEARVQDGFGQSASAGFLLRVCEAPLALVPGQSVSLSPSSSDGCGFFLPSGADGDRYRIGVVYPASAEDSLNVRTVSVAIQKKAGVSPAPSRSGGGPRLSLVPQTPASPVPAELTASFREALRVAEATEALHHRIRLAERRLLRRLGPQVRPLPDRRDLIRTGAGQTPGPATASPNSVAFTNPDSFSVCTVGETRRALKVGENDVMVIYQDSIQRNTSPVSANHAQWMLDYYVSYGKPVIDSYFGGTTDINGDGKIVVFVTPEVEEGTAAFVWNGDFYPKTSQPPWGACPASNEMELMRFSQGTIQNMADGNYQTLATLVHEVKHISSLYNSIIRGDRFPDPFQPLWVEEGTAEIAGELSSRLAWEATGGPAVGAKVLESHVGSINKENYGIILRAARTTNYLSSQPNGIVVSPAGADEDHSVYGSGWHFHRWLGDAYGNAATRLGDSTLFRALNDSVSAAGVQGVRDQVGGKSWANLLEEYAAAVMLNGTTAPLGPLDFTTYDFPGLNRTFTYTGKPTGDYPWPVRSMSTFGAATNTGPIGPSGIRILDLTSDGTGMGVDVKVTAESVGIPSRVVVVRLR